MSASSGKSCPTGCAPGQAVVEIDNNPVRRFGADNRPDDLRRTQQRAGHGAHRAAMQTKPSIGKRLVCQAHRLAGRHQTNRAGRDKQLGLENASARHDRELRDCGIGDEPDPGLQSRDTACDRRASGRRGGLLPLPVWLPIGQPTGAAPIAGQRPARAARPVNDFAASPRSFAATCSRQCGFVLSLREVAVLPSLNSTPDT